MTVQRFNPVATAAISLSEQGEYVKYADYEKLAAENAGLKDALEYVINPDNQPEYHDQGMGCGVEDRGYQRDGYSACAYGWAGMGLNFSIEVRTMPKSPAERKEPKEK